MPVFTGSFLHTMDKKGRLSIPARYRDVLHQRQDRSLILTNFEGYIMAFPQSEWLKVTEELNKQPTFDKEIRRFIRFLNARAEECSLDRMGRILIPTNLRDYANLERDVCIVGTGRTFEIWNPQTYEEHDKQLEESIGEEVYKKLPV